MEITDVLKKIGLSNKEAQVYLALLELGLSSVDAIAKKAGTKRPTTYLVLDDLQSRGLVSLVPRERKALYVAESPEQIGSEIARKQELLTRFLPELLAIYNTRKDKPQVQLFEGREGVTQVYNKVFSSPEIWFFATIRQVFAMFPEMEAMLKQKLIKREIKVREILTRTPEDIKYLQSLPAVDNYRGRLASKDTPEFLTDNAFFGDSVAFFSFSPKIFAVIITSVPIVKSLRALYELAWQAAEPYSSVLAASREKNRQWENRN